MREQASVEMLYQVAAKLSGQQREEFLAALAADQQQWIRSQLSIDAPTIDFDGSNTDGTAPTIDVDPLTLVPGNSAEENSQSVPGASDVPGTIGPYKIRQQIGRGGMGQVFLAEQSEPIKRRVALKIIKTDTPSREILARFEAERQALAMMDHQNIAKVLDAGITADGRPYFAMELVNGIPITAFCDQYRLTPTQRLELFVQTCRAIQHAHQKGIIHRDIKPSNVLVTMYDGRPVVKVIDFGLAKALQEQTELTERTLFTQYGQIVGTLEYMSPEQAELSSVDIDTRTDVYSLGVIMYELLTGSTPLGRERVRAHAYDRILRLIREEEVPRLSTRLIDSGTEIVDISQRRSTEPKRLRSLLRGDLQWIAMKALEKDRTRRYDTAAALAEEVQRHLDDEPISARPPTLSYRLQKAYRKHKAGFVTAVTIACLLIAGLFGTGTMWWRAETEASKARLSGLEAKLEAQKSLAAKTAMEQQRDRAVTAETAALTAKQEVESTLARSNYFLAFARWDANRISDAIDLLSRVPEHLRHFEWYLARRKFTGGDLTLYGHTSAVTSVAYSPDGQRLASASWDKSINLWDAQTGELLRTLRGHSANVTTVAFSSDGKRLASGSADKTIRIWDLLTDKSISLTGHSGPINSVCFSPHDGQLASGSWDHSIKIWKLESGETLQTLSGHGSEVFAVAYAPDGTQLASCGRDNTIRLWDVQTGATTQVCEGHRDRVTSVVYSPDGRSIASGSFDQSIRLWDAVSGQSLQTLKGHTGHVTSVAFSPDGVLLASASDDYRQPGSIRVWNVDTGTTIQTLKGHQHGVNHVTFSPSGTRIASAGGYGENTIKLWDARTGDENLALFGHRDRVTSIAVSHDGKRIASGSFDLSLTLWDAQTWHKIAVLEGHRGTITAVAFTPDGSSVISASEDRLIKIWDAATGQLQRTLTDHSGSVSSVAVSPDGRLIASGSWDQSINLWDLKTGELIQKLQEHTAGVLCVAFSSSGQLLASAGGVQNDAVKIWEIDSGQVLHSLSGHTNYITGVAFSPDESRLATVSSDRSIKLWDVESGALLQTLERHTNRVNHVAFNPDGSRLATAGYDNTIRLWDAESGEELQTLRGHNNYVTGVAFSPDGTFLASSSWDKTIRVWLATHSGEQKTLPGHTVTRFAFDANGSRIVSASNDHTLKVWDLATGRRLLSLDNDVSPVSNVGFDQTGSRILSYHDDGSQIAWNVQTGEPIRAYADWPEQLPQPTDRSPDGRWLVQLAKEKISVIDLQFKHTPVQRDYRRFKSAFDPFWHYEQAAIAETAKHWFPALFHRAWILRQDFTSNESHWRMRMVVEKIRQSEPLLLTLLSPTLQDAIASPAPPLNPTYADKFNFTILARVTDPSNEPITEVSVQELMAICQKYEKPSYYHTLGISLYRAGEYETALEKLYVSLLGMPGEFNLTGPHPGDLAFLAMCYLKAGQREVAEMFRQELSAAVKNEAFDNEQLHLIAKRFLAEVDALFAGEPSS